MNERVDKEVEEVMRREGGVGMYRGHPFAYSEAARTLQREKALRREMEKVRRDIIPPAYRRLVYVCTALGVVLLLIMQAGCAPRMSHAEVCEAEGFIRGSPAFAICYAGRVQARSISNAAFMRGILSRPTR